MKRPLARIGLVWLAAVLLLSGCLKPLVTGSPLSHAITPGRSVADLGAPPPLVGKVDSFLYRAQASTVTDIAVGSTVSFIDTATNNTVNTTVTDSTGAFKIIFTRDFTPSTSRVYYLEAYKGLPIGGASNRAGISLARVRTLVRFDGTAWQHLYGTEGIRISLSSTALSVITSLRAASTIPVDPMTLLGSLTLTDVFTPGSSGVTGPEYTDVRSKVS